MDWSFVWSAMLIAYQQSINLHWQREVWCVHSDHRLFLARLHFRRLNTAGYSYSAWHGRFQLVQLFESIQPRHRLYNPPVSYPTFSLRLLSVFAFLPDIPITMCLQKTCHLLQTQSYKKISVFRVRGSRNLRCVAFRKKVTSLVLRIRLLPVFSEERKRNFVPISLRLGLLSSKTG